MWDKHEVRIAMDEMARERRERPSEPQDLFGALLTLLSLLFFALIIWIAFRYGPLLLTFLGSFITEAWLRLIYLTMILCTAIGLYFFRKKMKWLYGISECGFGSVLAWTSLNDIRAGLPTNFIPLLAAAYFIVRGLVNWREGLEERRKRLKT
jgi:hypothetical protein